VSVFGALQVLLATSADGGEPDVRDGKVVRMFETPVQRERDLTTLGPGPA
jgi:hypothetical protein